MRGRRGWRRPSAADLTPERRDWRWRRRRGRCRRRSGRCWRSWQRAGSRFGRRRTLERALTERPTCWRELEAAIGSRRRDGGACRFRDDRDRPEAERASRPVTELRWTQPPAGTDFGRPHCGADERFQLAALNEPAGTPAPALAADEWRTDPGADLCQQAVDAHAARRRRPALASTTWASASAPATPAPAAWRISKQPSGSTSRRWTHAGRRARPARQPQQPGHRPPRPLCPHRPTGRSGSSHPGLQQAVDAHAARRARPARLLNNLGTGLRDRYARTGAGRSGSSHPGRPAGGGRHAVRLRPTCPRPHNLGTGLRARYARTGQLADLEAAIRVYQQAVARTPADAPDLPCHLNNLGTGLRDRYARTGRLDDLEAAIRVYQQAVARTPPDAPDLPATSTTWAPASATAMPAPAAWPISKQPSASSSRPWTARRPTRPTCPHPQQPGQRPPRPLCPHRPPGGSRSSHPGLPAGGGTARRPTRPTCPPPQQPGQRPQRPLCPHRPTGRSRRSAVSVRGRHQARSGTAAGSRNHQCAQLGQLGVGSERPGQRRWRRIATDVAAMRPVTGCASSCAAARRRGCARRKVCRATRRMRWRRRATWRRGRRAGAGAGAAAGGGAGGEPARSGAVGGARARGALGAVSRRSGADAGVAGPSAATGQRADGAARHRKWRRGRR